MGSPRERSDSDEKPCLAQLPQHLELPFEAADLESKGEIDATSLRRQDVKGFRRVVFNFTPQWFLITMGSGMVARLLFETPLGKPAWLYWISVLAFALDVLLFCIFLLISTLRYFSYPQLFPIVLRHPAQALFLGPFTVSFATITNLMVLICLPAWGEWMVNWIWAFWWLDTVLSFAVLLGVMYCLFKFHGHKALDEMLATWLLPPVSAIVASSSAGVVAKILPPHHAIWTLTIGLMLWGMGILMAFLIMAMYFHRLALSHFPSNHVIFSVFMPLGPLAQGAHGIMELGSDALRLFPETGTLPAAASAGQIFYTMAWLISVVFWAFALLWLLLAIMIMIDRRKFPFNLSWWSLIFPTGIFALATLQIGEEMPSAFLKYLGSCFTVMNVAAWLCVSILTVRGIWKGVLFRKQPNPISKLPSKV